ncbi:MAG: single-stranded-DNA-specific exonuclease RecJ [Candidatus Cloacimonadales bacterium]|jgi:single-stranded-DNA-specific exonuclease|nr:single-stranded-DNA-specific exonuclease RecJ [Candidatus Cloacimonadota bacterium]MDD2649632.1 single-stranded-DNA-specific exonuclease RecJ [Candidatus Cloacimonadota bacterium]MDD3501103.1 single-stranded-DNA-specific exonuclease RecJ [Candidatus Cloacimonadota bacterium]MDX9976590.1 single-stranded-DNA-specific exonuclease RecJ [Candidatus Cloacimonadales bacterium]
MQKRWDIAEEITKQTKQRAKALASEAHCPLLIAELLISKEIDNLDDLEQFITPSLDQLHDPFLFKEMEKCVDKVLQTIENGEQITIYGDYDVDGTTATALLYLGLKDINAKVDYYIPHRMEDGYGLSTTGLELLRDKGTKLIISVDCGINAVEEVDIINDMGMEIIITDHHNAKNIMPNAYAMINPKLEDSQYPDKDLAGVGVAYKLLMAVYKKLGIFNFENRMKYIDLVAVGTIADIVPLVGENRVFASLGLEKMQNIENKGLLALIDIAEISLKRIDTTDIVFGLAPRINAAGRMSSAMQAVELLIADDETRCRDLAEIIERDNSLRQQIDQKTFQEASEIIEKKYKDIKNTYCMILSSDSWHPGVIGIVSSKLVEKFYRPTIMISYHDGIGSGSGRSINEIDLFEALSTMDDLLESFGGHKYAVGLTILPEYIDSVENRLTRYIKERITPEQMLPLLKIDKKIELYEIDEKLMKWLQSFAPYGPENNQPVFYAKDVMIVGYPYTVGRNHLKLKVTKDGCVLDLIGFNLGDFLPVLKREAFIDICFTLEINYWKDKSTIQGNLKDIKLVDNK